MAHEHQEIKERAEQAEAQLVPHRSGANYMTFEKRLLEAMTSLGGVGLYYLEIQHRINECRPWWRLLPYSSDAIYSGLLRLEVTGHVASKYSMHDSGGMRRRQYTVVSNAYYLERNN